jgi:hypothetical protein
MGALARSSNQLAPPSHIDVFAKPAQSSENLITKKGRNGLVFRSVDNQQRRFQPLETDPSVMPFCVTPIGVVCRLLKIFFVSWRGVAEEFTHPVLEKVSLFVSPTTKMTPNLPEQVVNSSR